MNHLRHSGIFNASDTNVTLIGAGGIGAITALTLAKMGVGFLAVYDDDTVSEENLATQLHKLHDLGMSKVHALKNTLHLFADDVDFFPSHERITEGEELFGQIVISAVDSIAARKTIWQAVNAGRVQWYIDARMAAEEAHIFAVDMANGQDWAWYNARIEVEDDSQIAPIPCTAKSTFFCGALIAGLLGSTVRKIITGIKPARYLVMNLVTDTFLVSK